MCPFDLSPVRPRDDPQGYCNRHVDVRLAKKKLTGGWKILQEFCAACAEEDRRHKDDRSVGSRGRSVGSRGSGQSRRSVSRDSRRSRRSRSAPRGPDTRRTGTIDDDPDEPAALPPDQRAADHRLRGAGHDTEGGASARRHPGSRRGGVGEDALPASRPERRREKSGRNVNSADDDGGSRRSRRHDDGGVCRKEWCEGLPTHGKTSRGMTAKHGRRRVPGSKNGSRNGNAGSANNGSIHGTIPAEHNGKTPVEERKEYVQKQEAFSNYRNLYNSASSIVKNMLFVDFYGDRGRYTGEVNGQKVPHGLGEIIYDHGLVQEGEWTNGVLDEDGSTAR